MHGFYCYAFELIDLSPTMSNLPLIPSRIFFNSDIIVFNCVSFDIWSLLYLPCLNFLKIWNTDMTTFFMSLPANSNTCVSAGLFWLIDIPASFMVGHFWLDANYRDYYLVGARRVCISINSPEICSRRQLFERSLILLSLHVRFIIWDQRSTQSRTNFSHCWSKISLNSLPRAYESWGFLVWWMGKNTSPSLVWVQSTVTSSRVMWFFSHFWGVSS